jgi:hypothetical protein
MTSDPAATPQPSTTAEVVPATNGFKRVAGVLFAPVETFREIAARPDILVPVAVIVIISILSSIIIAPRVDFETAMREQFAQAGRNMSQEDMDRAVRFSTAIAKAMIYVAPLLNMIFFAAVAGIFLLGFRLFGGEGNFKQAFSVTLYSWMPMMIAAIAMLAILIARGNVGAEELNGLVMSNLGFLVDLKENPVVYALLSSIDVFTFWTLALFVIGFSFVSRLSRGKSAAIVLTLWVVMIVIKVGFAALGAARASGA